MKKLLILFFMLISAPAAAQSFTVHGMGAFRVVAPSDEISWHDGGYGRLRYGAEQSDSAAVFFSDIYVEPRLQMSSSLSAFAVVKHDREQDEWVDIVEGYLQWKPVSTGAVRWSARAGAFFPPISFENDDIGWTNPYTITSSAINSWLGEELRVIGAEGTLEWRARDRNLSLTGALYGWNDPIGVLLAVRGWGMTDRSVGLLDRVRLTDAFSTRIGAPLPHSEEEIREIDNRVGWYLGAEYEERDRFRIRGLYYDNRADPAAEKKGQQAWLTRFWSGGGELPIGQWTFIAQGMTGHTDIDIGFAYLKTDFSSAFFMAARDIGDFRLSGRFDVFRTDEVRNEDGQGRKEDGGAVTLAARWYASDNVQLIAEALVLESDRPERSRAGLPVAASENQFQFVVQLRF